MLRYGKQGDKKGTTEIFIILKKNIICIQYPLNVMLTKFVPKSKAPLQGAVPALILVTKQI